MKGKKDIVYRISTKVLDKNYGTPGKAISLNKAKTEINLRIKLDGMAVSYAPPPTGLFASFKGGVTLSDHLYRSSMKMLADIVTLADGVVSFRITRPIGSELLASDSLSLFSSKGLYSAVDSEDLVALQPHKPFFDNTTASSEATISASFNKHVEVGLSDSSDMEISKVVSLSLMAFDTLSKSFGKAKFDELAIEESYKKHSSKATSDGVLISDTLLPFTVGMSIKSSVIATDDFHGTSNVDDDQTACFAKVAKSSIKVSDRRRLSLEREMFVDTVSNKDSGRAILQGYAASDYFAEEYTGSITLF